MSVRSTLLAILTIGPAYGFQLHGEIQSRTAHRRTINVGQIYSTLDRAIDQGAVRSAGLTVDGLPLYELTDRGRAEAMTWLTSTTSASGAEWDDMIDRVLLSSSIPGNDPSSLIAEYRAFWTSASASASASAAQTVPETGEPSGQVLLAAAGRESIAAAALDWLAQAESLIETTGPGAFQRALNSTRPKRGRRPAAAGHTISAAAHPVNSTRSAHQR